MGLLDLPRDAPHYVHEVVVQRAVPKCDSCELYVPGLLTLPVLMQPRDMQRVLRCGGRLKLEPSTGARFAGKRKALVRGVPRSRGSMCAVGRIASMPKLGPSRHPFSTAKALAHTACMPSYSSARALFTPLAAVPGQRPQSYLAAKEAHATATERIRAVCEGTQGRGPALLLHRLRWPAGSQGEPTDAKVLIVPPAHKDVRSELISRLRAALGKDAIADLNNDKGAAAGRARR